MLEKLSFPLKFSPKVHLCPNTCYFDHTKVLNYYPENLSNLSNVDQVVTVSSVNTDGVNVYLYYQDKMGAPQTLAQDDFGTGALLDDITFMMTTPGWSTVTGSRSVCRTLLLIIYMPVTATDKNGVVSVSESRKVFIEEANYPDLVQCDIVARYGMVLRAL